MSSATTTAYATNTASAANKTWIFKKIATGNTREKLEAAVNDYCHGAGGCFPSASGSPLLFFF